VYKPEWKIQAAKDLEELQTLVNKIQGEGYIIEDINTTSLVVVYYKYNEEKEKELLVERQDEGRISNPLDKDHAPGFEWDYGDYGQQLF
jgi:hypothetical protein